MANARVGGGGQREVSTPFRCRARRERSASREAAARWRTTGSDPPRKRTLRGNRAAGARTSRQSTNVMERSVVNEHSSCHICERRMATDHGPLWSPRQPQWRPASRSQNSFGCSRVLVRHSLRISTPFLVMRALLSDCLLIRFSTISAGYGKFNEFQQVKIGVEIGPQLRFLAETQTERRCRPRVEEIGCQSRGDGRLGHSPGHPGGSRISSAEVREVNPRTAGAGAGAARFAGRG